MLTYLEAHSYIETLCLTDLEFSSPTPLIGILTALPRLKHLICKKLVIGGTVRGSVQVVEYGSAYSRKPTKLRSLVVCKPQFAPEFQAILPLAGGTVEHLVLELDLAVANSRDSSRSWETYQAALASVSRLEIHVHLSEGEGVEEDHHIIGLIDHILPAFKPHALQDMSIVFHGSSYRLHRLLENPDSTAVLGSLQQSILRHSLKSVTFTTATTQRVKHSMLTSVLLKRSFPVLFERALAKAIFPEVHIGHESLILMVLVSPDGHWVATASEDDSVIVWRTEDGSVVADWNVPLFRGLMFTPGGRGLIICSRDRLIVRDMQYPFKIVADTPLEPDASTCVWSPDGTLFALPGQRDRYDVAFSIRIYTTGTLEAMSDYRLQLPHRPSSFWGSTGPVFSRDSRRLLFTQNASDRAADGSEESESISWIWDVYSTGPPRKLMNHGAAVFDSTFNPVDSAQVFLTLMDGTVQVREVASGTVLINLGRGEKTGRLSWPLYSPNGRLVATGARDGHGRLCNLETGAVVRSLEGTQASWLSFSPDGARILSTSPDAPAQLWDTHTGWSMFSLVAHINLVNAAAFTPDGRYIATGYEDGTVRLWNAEDGTCLAVFTEHGAAVTHFAYSLDGQILCSAAKDGTVYVRRLRSTLE